ncbi:MAG: hypothetical protein L0H73_03230 [Nitrococcus sp.]|nr:hypothetical protein [Nitrococcus sp.]
MLIPALSLSERDRHAGRLSEHQMRFVYRVVTDIVEGLGEQFDMTAASRAVPPGAAEDAAVEPKTAELTDRRSLRIICFPAEDEVDRIRGRMLVQLLAARGHAADAAEVQANSDAAADLVRQRAAECVMISALAPGGAIAAREGCQRLRQTEDGFKTVIGLWNAGGDLKATQERLAAAGADFVTASLTQGLHKIEQFAAPVS